MVLKTCMGRFDMDVYMVCHKMLHSLTTGGHTVQIVYPSPLSQHSRVKHSHYIVLNAQPPAALGFV